MKTPFGFECPYFYGDYFRGRHIEECRLIGKALPPNHWQVKYCQHCKIPAIKRANNCENMVLTAEIKPILMGVKRVISIKAYCTKTHQVVVNPYVGCGECHPIIEKLKKQQ